MALRQVEVRDTLLVLARSRSSCHLALEFLRTKEHRGSIELGGPFRYVRDRPMLSGIDSYHGKTGPPRPHLGKIETGSRCKNEHEKQSVGYLDGACPDIKAREWTGSFLEFRRLAAVYDGKTRLH